MDSLFLSWHDSRRSRSLARLASLPFVSIAATTVGFRRHLLGSLETAAFLMRQRPRTVWFQFSLGLAVVLGLYRAARAFAAPVRLVADVHTKALRRDGGWPVRLVIAPLKRWILRSCDAVLVTNEDNRDYALQRFGVDALILPDPLPAIPAEAASPARARASERRRTTVFVCSFARDEPLDLIMQAAARLSAETDCVATGDPSVMPTAVRERMERALSLTGFIGEPDYWRLLRNADAIVVLSTEPACLPCGAYEAIALGSRPVLLSDPIAIRVFGELALFAAPTDHDLALAVRKAWTDEGRVSSILRSQFEQGWREQWQKLAHLTATRDDVGTGSEPVRAAPYSDA